MPTRKVRAQKSGSSSKAKSKPSAKSRSAGRKLASAPERASRSLDDWMHLAEQQLPKLLAQAQKIKGLQRLGPKVPWQIAVQMVSAPEMTELNALYRKKAYPTDVLSFPAPHQFRTQGILGELVICAPTLVRQAEELGHRPEHELQVLLVHGILHLLGMDHELGEEEAKEMGAWERKLLGKGHPGLIDRNHGTGN